MASVTVDLITTTPGGLSFRLIVATREYQTTEVEWLREKVQGYLDIISYGVLWEKYPDLRELNAIIQVDHEGDLPVEIEDFIRANQQITLEDRSVELTALRIASSK